MTNHGPGMFVATTIIQYQLQNLKFGGDQLFSHSQKQSNKKIGHQLVYALSVQFFATAFFGPQ